MGQEVTTYVIAPTAAFAKACPKALNTESTERRQDMRTKAIVSMRQAFTAVATLAAVLLVAGVAAAQQKPNSILILSDDFGYGDSGPYGGGPGRGMPTPSLERLALLVHHTDAEREWAYDRTSSIGRLDKALDEAQARGWTVVSMKDDWKRIFPFGAK
jgi:hypothetical protein